MVLLFNDCFECKHSQMYKAVILFVDEKCLPVISADGC